MLTAHLPRRTNSPCQHEHGRYGFIGREAPDQIQKLYVGKRVPDEFRQRGAANPIKYASVTK